MLAFLFSTDRNQQMFNINITYAAPQLANIIHSADPRKPLRLMVVMKNESNNKNPIQAKQQEV
jgi:hypothetical protein